MQPQNVSPALASSSDVAWLCLLTITADGEDPLYVVNNSEEVVSRGITFEPYPFTVTLPPDDSETLPTVSLSISNIDRSIVEFLRAQLMPPSIAIELVTSAYPDVVEKSLTFLKLTSVTYDAITVSGTLAVDNFLTQKFPDESYVPPLFPGMFR